MSHNLRMFLEVLTVFRVPFKHVCRDDFKNIQSSGSIRETGKCLSEREGLEEIKQRCVCVTEGRGCDKVRGEMVQNHRWRHLASLKRKDAISSTDSGHREVRTAQRKVSQRRGYLKAFLRVSHRTFCLPSPPHLPHYMGIFSSWLSLPLCCYLIPHYEKTAQ